MNYYQGIIYELKRKWWVVALCAIFFSCILVGERLLRPKVIIKSSDLHYEQILKIDYADKNYHLSNTDYRTVLLAYSELDKLLERTEDTIDYSRIELTWNKMKKREKFEWLQKHLFLNNINSDLCQIVFSIKENEPKDADYLADNATTFMNNVVEQMQSSLNDFGVPAKVTVKSFYKDLPHKTEVSSKRGKIKFGIIGAVLGGMFGVALVVVNFIRKTKNA